MEIKQAGHHGQDWFYESVELKSQKADSSVTAVISVGLQLKLGASEEGPQTEKSLNNYSLAL